MKTLFSFLLFFLSCANLKAQDLYPILVGSYKHLNVYDYRIKSNMQEKIDVSIKLKKITINNIKTISDALTSVGFEFDNLNDTLLIVASYSDVTSWAPPSTLLVRSSKSIKLLTICDLKNGIYEENMRLIEPNPFTFPASYYRTNAYAFMVLMMDDDTNKYVENYFNIVSPESPDVAKEFFLKEMSGEYPQNYYSMMYHGNVDAFRELYIKSIGIVLGGYDTVLRLIIKDGKVVPPSLLWRY